MTPFDKPYHDTWLDRLWHEYINLRKMDLYVDDEEPPGSDPAKDHRISPPARTQSSGLSTVE